MGRPAFFKKTEKRSLVLQYLRRIPFECIANFRDLGGYAAEDGRATAFGRFYRCDNLSDISEADRQKVLSLGVETIVDLRTNYEAAMAPDRFGEGDGVRLIHVSPLEGLVDIQHSTQDELGALDMGSLYVQMLAGKTAPVLPPCCCLAAAA